MKNVSSTLQSMRETREISLEYAVSRSRGIEDVWLIVPQSMRVCLRDKFRVLHTGFLQMHHSPALSATIRLPRGSFEESLEVFDEYLVHQYVVSDCLYAKLCILIEMET